MTESTYETTSDVAILTLSNPPANLFTRRGPESHGPRTPVRKEVLVGTTT